MERESFEETGAFTAHELQVCTAFVPPIHPFPRLPRFQPISVQSTWFFPALCFSSIYGKIIVDSR